MDNNLASFIRMLLAGVGAFFIGKTVFGTPITNEILDVAIGIVLELFSLIWGIKAKTNTLEMYQSAIRNLFSFIGGFFVAKGKLNSDTLTTIIGAATSLAAFLYSYLSKKKSQMLETGKIAVAQLVKPSK